MKCKYCGKEYIKNPAALPDWMPLSMKEQIKFIPACNCLEKQKIIEMEQAEKERQHQCILNKVKRYRDISVIDNKFLKSKFEIADMNSSIMSLANKYSKSFLKENIKTGLFLFGNVGTGKTFASACIANRLMENGKTVLVMNLGLYINKLQREWAEAEKDVLEYVKNCDLLIIDDMGVENVKEWTQDKVFSLIDTRYRAEKPLIITTNLVLFNKGLPKEQIEAKLSIESRFSSRIADRINEMCYQHAVIGESKRNFDIDNFKEILKRA